MEAGRAIGGFFRRHTWWKHGRFGYGSPVSSGGYGAWPAERWPRAIRALAGFIEAPFLASRYRGMGRDCNPFPPCIRSWETYDLVPKGVEVQVLFLALPGLLVFSLIGGSLCESMRWSVAIQARETPVAPPPAVPEQVSLPCPRHCLVLGLVDTWRHLDMHVHVHHPWGVRTTVEISDSQRARLLKLAAERGEKGFSRLVGEALERFLAEEGSRKERIQKALALEGTFGSESADAIEASVRRIRSTWR